MKPTGWAQLLADRVAAAADRTVRAMLAERVEREAEIVSQFVRDSHAERAAGLPGLRSVRVLYPFHDSDSARRELDAQPTGAWLAAKQHRQSDIDAARRLAALARAACEAGAAATVTVTDTAFHNLLSAGWSEEKGGAECQRGPK